MALPAVAPVCRTVAVIELGTTSLRMVIAEITPDKPVRYLEFLQQAVGLGKDSFTKGIIKKETTEECVAVLRRFSKICAEYQVVHPSQFHVVATTAVREAQNREQFVDRLAIANGVKVEVLEDIDITRLTYLSVKNAIARDVKLSQGGLLVAEMGGGSTESIFLQDGKVSMSSTFRLGSMRLHELFQTIELPVMQQRNIIEADISQTIDQIKKHPQIVNVKNCMALGGDMRAAVACIKPGSTSGATVRISLGALSKFIEDIFPLSVNELVSRYGIQLPEAETIRPVLLFYLRLAQSLNLRSIVAADCSMRGGLLLQLSQSGAWTEDVRDQILLAAAELGKRFQTDTGHVAHVAFLSTMLFEALQTEHRLDAWHKLLLTVAALLHDIGQFVSIRSHHKHSAYLIQNSELFGLSRRDLSIVAQIARYHRRTPPKPVHVDYALLEREDRIVVSKLAAILRVADALDRSHTRRISDLQVKREGDRFVIQVPAPDMSLEQVAMQSKADLFEEVYGMKVVLRAVAAS